MGMRIDGVTPPPPPPPPPLPKSGPKHYAVALLRKVVKKEEFLTKLKKKNKLPSSTKVPIKDIRGILIGDGLPRETTGSAISHCFTNGASAIAELDARKDRVDKINSQVSPVVPSTASTTALAIPL